MSIDDAIDWGYELFLAKAADHLPPEDVVDITLEFEERGAVEAVLPGAQWIQELGGPFAADNYTEIQVGLLDEQDEFEVIHCRILIALDGSQPPRFIWKS
ncbi:DUF440 family protein [Gallaecimonas xiamenensis]|uniref:DsDNA-mimic protein n=1 Tax=Gallaecimonas xiamenensis 3-C-1 TaxID=745411 RepID=K2JTK4_9GAMM|nr:DUF440 family protein [Gallaecimonas xiamenensis]EKE77862.1 dsDNA-mimic protein [Gallaecimonas xiamenensis 3-C-1]